jgi:hypothetical protein
MDDGPTPSRDLSHTASGHINAATITQRHPLLARSLARSLKATTQRLLPTAMQAGGDVSGPGLRGPPPRSHRSAALLDLERRRHRSAVEPRPRARAPLAHANHPRARASVQPWHTASSGVGSEQKSDGYCGDQLIRDLRLRGDGLFLWWPQ